MPVRGHPGTGPDGQRQGTMGLTVEAGPERLRHQLRRKNHLNANPGSTAKRTLPEISESDQYVAGEGPTTGASSVSRNLWFLRRSGLPPGQHLGRRRGAGRVRLNHSGMSRVGRNTFPFRGDDAGGEASGTAADLICSIRPTAAPATRAAHPRRGRYGRTRTLSDSRESMARYPSGTSSRLMVRSKTFPGLTVPSRTPGNRVSM
jgi:hypothetical protein